LGAYRFSQATRTDKEQDYASNMEAFFNSAPMSGFEKANNWPLFCSRQQLSKYLARVELFQKILPVHGDVVEGGALFGGATLLWGQLSAIYEPVNPRRVIAFDTFSGHKSFTDSDKNTGEGKDGGFNVDSEAVINEAAELFDSNRAVGHIKKIETVRGDACKTIPKYIKYNPSLVVALLVLDFDIEKPTLSALEHFVPRMPKGACIIFDELGSRNWSGESKSVFSYFKLNNLSVKRFPFTSTLSYAIL